VKGFLIATVALCLVLGAAWLVVRMQNESRPTDRLAEPYWKVRHDACVASTEAGGFDVAFLGDSITQEWETVGREAWNTHVAPLKAANFGFSGDRTEHVLWRLDNGEVIGAKPKAVVLLIGTNNIGHGQSAEETAAGIKAVVTRLRSGLPNAKILLLAPFPRGAELESPERKAVEETARLIRGLADGTAVIFRDLGTLFTRPDGSIDPKLMPDYLHLSAAGYELWGKALAPELERMLGEGKQN
jgi:lysophospholipase L1-like esterase